MSEYPKATTVRVEISPGYGDFASLDEVCWGVPDDEVMWCFRHSEEPNGPEGVKCYKSGYKGDCDVGLAYMYRANIVPVAE